jgi:hypothetical protein
LNPCMKRLPQNIIGDYQRVERQPTRSLAVDKSF